MPLQFQHHPGLVAYFTCGDPDLATTRDVAMAAIRAGADVIELGVPFSDPVADGPVIQRASERALRQGVTLENVLQLGRELRQQSDAGLIVFTYMNPVLRFGLGRFCSALQDCGIDGALITDLPVEEAGEYVRCMRSRERATVFLVAPTSTDERLRAIADVSTGFVYAVSRTGVTGARQQFPDDARKLVQRLRRFTKLPVAVGFGISTPEQFAGVGEFADAAVVGSALVATVERDRQRAAQNVTEFITNLTSGARAAHQTAR